MAVYGTPNCGPHAPSASPSRTSSVICNCQIGQWLPLLAPIMAPLALLSTPAPVHDQHLCAWFLDYLEGCLSHLCTTAWFLEEPLSLKPRTSPHHEVTEAHTIGTALAVKEKNTKKSQWKNDKETLGDSVWGRGELFEFHQLLSKSSSE